MHRESTIDEYFNLGNLSEPLIREGIQNSLDAKADGTVNLPVKIRVMISGRGAAAGAEDIAPFFGNEFWRHVEGKHNGLYEPPKRQDRCPFLVFEDFGTTGLEGDYQNGRRPSDGEKNPFFYFFRAEGLSDKDIQERGRWGLGKSVFRVCSRTRSWFAYTIRRRDGRKLLMGRSVFKSRCLDGVDYTPDGFFGEPVSSGDLPIQPVEQDDSLLNHFRESFQLKRELGQSGTSIVIPWYNHQEISFEDLKIAIIRQYFSPILQGRLEVEISEAYDDPVIINGDFIREWANDENSPEYSEERAVVRLALWSFDHPEDVDQLQFPGMGNKMLWDKVNRDDDLWIPLREKFKMGKPVRMEVPVEIVEKNGPNGGRTVLPSSFEVIVSKDETVDTFKPIYVRNDLVLPEIKSPSVRGVCVLVTVQRNDFANVLGKAENPAHTTWEANATQNQAGRFQDFYVYAKELLSFVKYCPSSLVALLRERDVEEDPSLLLEFFSIEPDDADDELEVKGQRDTKKKGKESSKPGNIPKARPKRYRINKTPGGFTVVRGDMNADPIDSIVVEAAYDVRRGNPFTKYKRYANSNIYDFNFQKKPVEIDITGLKEISREPNKIELEIIDEDFRLVATGFDEKRDLKVKVTAREVRDDSSNN